MGYSFSALKAYANIVKNNFLNLINFQVYPRFAHYIFTWRCNLRCRNCSVWKKVDPDELDEEEVESLLAKIKFLDIIKVTGGEPFIRDDIISLISAIRRIINPYMIQITTNGTYTERILESIKRTHFPGLHLRISLDGVGEVHDKIRGMEGCYNKVRETISALIDLRKKLPFRLGINYSLREETVPFLPEMFKFCRENGIDLILGYPVKPFLKDIDFNSVDFSLETSDKVLKVYKSYVNLQTPGTNFLESMLANFLNKEFLRKKSINDLKFDCGELRDLIYILPDGNVITCGLRQKKIFNLLRDDFRRKWFAKEIKYWREIVDRCPGCMQTSIRILSRSYKLIQF